MLSNQPFFLEGKDDRVCLMLHGLGGGTYEMQFLGQYLHERGWSVQAINYQGQDKQGVPMPASTWQTWYARILEAYQVLAQRYRFICVIGFSTGCPLSLHLAYENRVDQLVLLSPYIAIRHQWYYFLRLEAYLFSIGHWVKSVPCHSKPIRDSKMRSAAMQAAHFHTFNLATVCSAVELIEQVKTEIPAIQAPTLIIQSSQDTVVDPPGAEFIYRHLGAATKKLKWLHQSDHIITLDHERETVFAEVEAFLS